MTRIRLAFLLLAVAVLAPVGLLVRRAFESVDLERRVRHAALAERLFDEMERALSSLLAREEERPFDHYEFYYAPAEQVGGPVAVARSPLAHLPDRPFVVGYFQIDPDGSFHTPLEPRDEVRARGAGDWPPPDEVLARVAQLAQLVPNAWPAAARRRATSPIAEALPGTTMALGGKTNERLRALGYLDADKEGSSYDALRSLNRKGVEQRAGRQAKVEYAPNPPERARLGAEADEPADAKVAEPRREADAPATVRVELAPMVGRVIDDRHMLLYRTVLREARGWRQGLVLDVPSLGAWLDEQAHVSDGLAPYARVTFVTPSAPAPAPEARGGFLYVHRFAEPFEDLAARVALAPLPGVGGGRYVALLSALLLVAGAGGLVALYRMVAVVVRYAERRSNFVAAVSHELKTPLTAIRMHAEMLRDGVVATEAKRDEYYTRITGEAERLSRLINNVLEFSQLEQNTRRLVLATGPLAPAIAEAERLLRPHAEREGFELRVEVEPDLPPVRFERDAVLQVLFNLVDNALKYAREASLRRVTLLGRRDGATVRLAVRDHGPGVAPSHLGRIFEPFYRGESELTRRSKGTGIGLALVRGLVERMGAVVSGRNVPEGGFEVEVVFPVAGGLGG